MQSYRIFSVKTKFFENIFYSRMKVTDKIAKFIDHKGLSHNEFDKKIGTSNGYINKLIRNEGSIGSDKIEKIACKFNDLNLDWLFRNEGDMIRDNACVTSVNDPEVKYEKQNNSLRNEIKELKDKIASLEEILRSKDETIETQKELIAILRKK